MNVMRDIRIEKITLNMGIGGAGEKLDKAVTMLGKISGKKPVKTKTMKRIQGWGLRPQLTIGTKVTLRGKEAEELLKRLLVAKENRLPENCFDNQGNFSFGVPEYIDVPGVEYVVEIGIIGFDVSVTLERGGFRIKRRRIAGKIPKRHRISKKDAIEFMRSKFKIKVGEEE